MALGIKILYPENVSEIGTSDSNNFINYNNKYITTENTNVTVTLRIRAISYDNFGEDSETPSITDPIGYIQISNDENFSTDRTLTLIYSENNQYDLSPLTGYTGAPIVTPIIAGDDDFGLNIMRITNWILDSDHGEKKVYVRFITSGMVPYTFPETTSIIKGYWDNIIVVKENPTPPTFIQVDNETTNHYIGKTTTFSWIEADDNISGIRGYNLDLELSNNIEIIEECSNIDDFNIFDIDEINNKLNNNEVVMHERFSSTYVAGDYELSNVSGASKIQARFTKTGAAAHGHELQFQNYLTSEQQQPGNYVVEAKLKPTIPSGATGTVYLSIQNFAALYTNGKSLNNLNAIFSVSNNYDVGALPASMDVEALTGIGILPATMSVSPTYNTNPFYVDMPNMHTNINSWYGAGADFILVEIDEDGQYHYVRPTWDANRLLTGFNRQTLSGLPFARDIDVNGVDQEIEFVYRENRTDVNRFSRNEFSFTNELSISNPEVVIGDPFTVLWQKFRVNKEQNNFNKIQILVSNNESKDRLVWFNLLIAAEGSDVAGAVSGIPYFGEDTTESNRKLNYTGAKDADNVYIWNSCNWVDGETYPEFNGTYYRRWNETILLQPGLNVVSFARSGFTGSSLSANPLTPGFEGWIGITATPIKNSSTFTTAGSWEFSDIPLTYVYWDKINKPIDPELPESLVMSRARSLSSSDISWVNEYKTTTYTTQPAIFRLINSANNILYSTFPEDICGEYAEIIVNWNQVGADNISRLIDSHTHTIPRLTGIGRNFLTGVRLTDIPVAEEAIVVYDDIRFSDNSLITNIDLSDDVGYEKESLNLPEEDVETIVEQTTWATTDWNRVWSRHYSYETGAEVGIDDNQSLKFSYTAPSADGIERASEVHYLTPTGGKTCEVSTRFVMDAYSIDSEYYVGILPSQYEATLIEITDSSEQGIPDDFFIFGFTWNGDVYLYRPDENNGILQKELIYASGSLAEFDWSASDTKIRIDNDTTPNSTSINVMFGNTILYDSNFNRMLLPESDQGYWIVLGFRGKREQENTLSLEVGNFTISEVSASNYTQVNNVLYGESMDSVPSGWWTSENIEQINLSGATPAGSWFLAGTTDVVSEDSVAKYNIPHRETAPYNVSGRKTIATGIDGSDSIGPSGDPDFSRFTMYANIDDIQTVPEFGEIERWIGPYLMMGYGLNDVEAGDAYRWHFNYSLAYPDSSGESEIIFGVANWLPTNEPATNSGLSFTTHQDSAGYSFTEDDLTENTKATIYALSGTDTIDVGIANGQYDNDNPARYAMFSFVSDGQVKYKKGRLLTTGASIDLPTVIGNKYLPSFGRLSVVVRPKNTPGSLNPIVTLSADNNSINAGESTTLRWQSTNATYVEWSNFEVGYSELTGSKIVTPTQSTDYTIIVKNSSGAQATATVRVNVTSVALNSPVINAFTANPNPVTIGDVCNLSWNVSNPTSTPMTVYLNGGEFSNQTVSPISGVNTSLSTTTSYTLTATNSNGTVSRTIQVISQTADTFNVILSSSSLSITAGSPITLTWFSTPTAGVSLVSSNFGASGVSGSKTIYPETLTTYSITVRNNSTSEEKTANITVNVGGYSSGTYQYINPLYLGVQKQISIYDETITPGTPTTYHYSLRSLSKEFLVKSISDIHSYWAADGIEYEGDSGVYTVDWRKYFWLIPGPWVPGATNSIVSANLTLACSQILSRGNNPSSALLYQITSPWDISTVNIPTVSSYAGITPPSFSSTGQTYSLSSSAFRNIIVNWNNNLQPNYGVMLYMNGYSDTRNIPATMDSQYGFSIEPYDYSSATVLNSSAYSFNSDLSIIPDILKYKSFASPSHPTPTWRPYWSISYQAISSSFIRTLNIPAGDNIQPYNIISAQSTSDPQYADVYIYVNDVLYASQTDIPLNFNTDDGIRFFAATRRKTPGDKYNTSATVSKFGINLINPRTQPENPMIQDLVLWSKTGGSLPANTLFYGRNVDEFQDESYYVNLVSSNSILAQGFIPDNERLHAISLKINSTSYSNIVAYICASDASGDPTLIPSSNHIVENNSNIIATSWARTWPGMKEAMFIFNPPITLTPSTLYYVVFDYLTSGYGSENTSYMPEATCYKWDGTVWYDVDSVCAFRTFSDIYVNTYNDSDAQRQNARVASTVNAGLFSASTERTTEVTVDLVAPRHPTFLILPPTIYLAGHDGETYVNNYGALMNLRIGAKDSYGSGIQDFRIIYYGNFDELLSTDFYQWNDDNLDDYINVYITYPGLFLDTKKVYAQLRDKVGNISETNELFVSFKYSFYEDTEPPYLSRVRIEGDATIDPDPNEAEVINTEITNNSLYVLDKLTGCKDFRINHNYETDNLGNLIYGQYQPYIPNFVDNLTGDDGIYTISVQCRDYGDNATREYIEHIKTISFEGQTYITEIPTVLIKYQPDLNEYLYMAATKRTHRANITCVNLSRTGYLAYTIYEPRISDSKQTFKNNETIVVSVNGLVVSSSEYTIDQSNDWIVFNNSLTEFDFITMDIIEEVAVLYKYENSRKVQVKVFDQEQERAIGAMAVYNSTLYIGAASGKIYAYNGIRTSASLYRVDDGFGNYIPISCMGVFRFEGEDRFYLYIGTYSSAQVYRYGGDSSNPIYGWNRLTTITTTMVPDTDVFAFEMYKNMLFVAAGPYGYTYKYQREYLPDSSVVETIAPKQLYSDVFNEDVTFRLNVLCLKNFDNKVFAGVDYNSSIFSYQYLEQEQPKLSEWKEIYNFGESFLDSPTPWEFYNQGNVDHNNTDKLDFTPSYNYSGDLIDSYMNIKGETGEYCLWVNKHSASTWQQVNNTTGWMIDFGYMTDSYSSVDESYQGIKIFDGTYELEFRIYANLTVSLISGENEESANITPPNSGERFRFRIAVIGQDVKIYVNNDNTPVIDIEDFLLVETKGKSILIGKIDIDSPKCYGIWDYLYYYINGVMDPVLVVERDFIRDQVIPFGEEVRFLESVTEIPIGETYTVDRLIAGVQPRDASLFSITDDPTTLITRTYIRETGITPRWSFDARYSSNCGSLINSLVDDDILLSIADISDDLLTYTPFNFKTFMENTPAVAMTRTANVYYRRKTQAYDSILKDTEAPEGNIIINEDTAAGALQVYALEIYDNSNVQITKGFAARYSALDVAIDAANNATDGNPNTYDSIGTSEIRYLQHTLSDLEVTKIKKIRWGCKASKPKTYKVEYLISGTWVTLVEMETDANNTNIFFEYVLPEEVNINAIRIYYTGDAETIQDLNNITISAYDKGIGVNSYRISSYSDFRDSSSMPGADSNGWIQMTDGTIIIDWNLISYADNWSVEEVFNSPITKAIEFDNRLIVGTRSGRIYVSSNGSAFILSATNFSSAINCFTEWNDQLYLGTDSGEIWSSEDGLDWNLTTAMTGISSRIMSLVAYNDILYIGTGNNGELYIFNSENETTFIKQFAATVISSLYVNGATLYIGLYPTGEIFTYNGSNFVQSIGIRADSINDFEIFNSSIYTACGNGKIYKFENSAWNLLFDSSIRSISGLQTYTNTGPEILSIVNSGAGQLGAGKWRYKITYIDQAGNESSAGESYLFENILNNSKFTLTWQEIDNAVGYRIYRCPLVNGVEDSERLLVADTTNIIEDTTFVDDGSYNILSGAVIGQDSDKKDIKEADVSPPDPVSNYLWMSGDSEKIYVYDKISISEIPTLSTYNGVNGIIQFKGQIYIYGQDRPYTDAELALIYNGQAVPSMNGFVIKYVGANVGSGYKTVYCQFKDDIDNISNVVSDKIFYNNLISKYIIEVEYDTDLIVDSYESTSSPTQKIYSAKKNIDQKGIYESEPFFAANLSRWDIIEFISQLPYNTEVELYVRTSTSREDLLNEEWQGPFELDNPNEDYDYYDRYGYYYSQYYHDYYYMDYSYYLEDEGIIETSSTDISYLSGQWIQFKLVLITENRGWTPKVFSVLIKYITTNAAMFYTTIFDLESIANNERAQTGDFDISRGILTWNGVIPSGGNIEFGISTKNLTSYDWADYQIITPNKVFEVSEPGEKFRIAAVLTSTDQDVAIIDEWAILFECGNKDIKVNLGQYTGL